jgi:pilus assembly protein CpaB
VGLKNKVLLFIAVSLGFISAFLVYNYLAGLTASREAEMVDVVVALTRIPANTEIRANMLAWKKIPKEGLHPDAVQNLQDLQGRITANDIFAGEQVLWSRLLPQGTVPGLAYHIPEDKRAITVAVNEVIGVAGFIKPGDKVDVIATFDFDPPQSATILQNVTILAIAQEMHSDADKDASLSTSVTFALSPNQAERLVLAESLGEIRLALRPPQAVGIASAQGTSTYDIVPLAYSKYGDALAGRQEVASRSEPAAPASSPLPSAASAALNETGIEIEIYRGTKREVQLVNE